MTKLVSRFLKDGSGATAIEYGLIAALISVALITGATTLGTIAEQRRSSTSRHDELPLLRRPPANGYRAEVSTAQRPGFCNIAAKKNEARHASGLTELTAVSLFIDPRGSAARMVAAAIFVMFPLCLAIAAFSDLFTMTIPNRVSIILVLSFLAIAPFDQASRFRRVRPPMLALRLAVFVGMLRALRHEHDGRRRRKAADCGVALVRLQLSRLSSSSPMSASSGGAGHIGQFSSSARRRIPFWPLACRSPAPFSLPRKSPTVSPSRSAASLPFPSASVVHWLRCRAGNNRQVKLPLT